jgi:hypothetical protein
MIKETSRCRKAEREICLVSSETNNQNNNQISSEDLKAVNVKKQNRYSNKK